MLCLLALLLGGFVALAADKPAPVTPSDSEASVEPAAADSGVDSIVGFERPAPSDALRQAAAAEPPKTSDPAELSAFYLKRARARREASEPFAAYQDFKRAVEEGRKATQADLPLLIAELGYGAVGVGNQFAAFRAFREALELTPPDHGNRIVTWSFQLTIFALSVGDLPVAKQASDRIAAIVSRVESQKRTPAWLPRARVFVPRTKAMLAFARGDLQAAEKSARLALQRATEIPRNATSLVAGQRVFLASVLRASGQVREAESEARAAIAAVQKAGNAPVTLSDAMKALVFILEGQGRYPEAERVARHAYELSLAAGFSPVGGALLPIASTLVGQERWAEAAQLFDKVRGNKGLGDERIHLLFSRNLNWMLTLIKTGKASAAIGPLTEAARGTAEQFGADSPRATTLQGLLALARRSAGEAAAGRDLVEAAGVLAQGGGLPDRTWDRFAVAIIDGALADLAPRNDAASAELGFELAQGTTQRAGNAAIAAATARAAFPDRALADLAREDQDGQRQLDAMEQLLAGAIETRADDAVVKTLREEIGRLRAARRKTAATLAKRFPGYADLTRLKPATLAETRAAMRADEAIVLYRSAPDALYVWAFGKTGDVVAARRNRPSAALAADIARLGAALRPSAPALNRLPVFDVGLAHALYLDLLGSVEAGWRGRSALVVVPDGPIGQIPLGLLVTAPTKAVTHGGDGVPFAAYRTVPWLVRLASETRLPSVASFARLRTTPPGPTARKPFIGFGDPIFEATAPTGPPIASPIATPSDVTTRGSALALRGLRSGNQAYSDDLETLPRLPDTALEVRDVARALAADPDRDTIIGTAVNEKTVLGMKLDDRRVIMFATHGLLPGDLSGLTQPALALSSPRAAGITGDGLLTMDKILGLRLDADWVVLSACNTGAPAGAEAISGLGRAFFYAGARALLVTLWPVETSSARALTTELFRRQAADPTLPRAAALRAAELALIDGPGFVDAAGKPVFSYAHPLFWAAYAALGDGGA